MNKIDFIRYLLNEIEEYQKDFTEKSIQKEKAYEKAKETSVGNDWRDYYDISIPPKSKALDACKIIRRVLLEISKGVA